MGDGHAYSRTHGEWVSRTIAVPVVVGVLVSVAYGLGYVVTHGIDRITKQHVPYPGLSGVGVYLAALVLGSAVVAGVVLRPKRLPGAGGAGSAGGPQRARVWTGAVEPADDGADLLDVDQAVTS